jgi:hypothetical protein
MTHRIPKDVCDRYNRGVQGGCVCPSELFRPVETRVSKNLPNAHLSGDGTPTRIRRMLADKDAVIAPIDQDD